MPDEPGSKAEGSVRRQEVRGIGLPGGRQRGRAALGIPTTEQPSRLAWDLAQEGPPEVSRSGALSRKLWRRLADEWCRTPAPSLCIRSPRKGKPPAVSLNSLRGSRGNRRLWPRWAKGSSRTTALRRRPDPRSARRRTPAAQPLKTAVRSGLGTKLCEWASHTYYAMIRTTIATQLGNVVKVAGVVQGVDWLDSTGPHTAEPGRLSYTRKAASTSSSRLAVTPFRFVPDAMLRLGRWVALSTDLLPRRCGHSCRWRGAHRIVCRHVASLRFPGRGSGVGRVAVPARRCVARDVVSRSKVPLSEPKTKSSEMTRVIAPRHLPLDQDCVLPPSLTSPPRT